MAVTDDIDEALDCIDTLKSALESARDEIEDQDDRITELEEQAGNFSACDAEYCATALLQKYQGGTPSAGDVVRLKEKIEKLLVDEFHVSSGNL